jgi:hypothetical protein
MFEISQCCDRLLSDSLLNHTQLDPLRLHAVAFEALAYVIASPTSHSQHFGVYQYICHVHRRACHNTLKVLPTAALEQSIKANLPVILQAAQVRGGTKGTPHLSALVPYNMCKPILSRPPKSPRRIMHIRISSCSLASCNQTLLTPCDHLLVSVRYCLELIWGFSTATSTTTRYYGARSLEHTSFTTSAQFRFAGIETKAAMKTPYNLTDHVATRGSEPAKHDQGKLAMQIILALPSLKTVVSQCV